MKKLKYKKICFPKDGSVHDEIIEWWYFNGHLKECYNFNDIHIIREDFYYKFVLI